LTKQQQQQQQQLPTLVHPKINRADLFSELRAIHIASNASGALDHPKLKIILSSS